MIIYLHHSETQSAADVIGEAKLIRLQWEEICNSDKESARMVLVVATDSLSLQAACKTDMNDKHTVIDVKKIGRHWTSTTLCGPQGIPKFLIL